MRLPIRRGLGLTLATLATLVALTTAASAATPLTVERVASGLTRPVFVTAPPGDVHRLFVVEQRADTTGRIRIVKDGVLLPTPFLEVHPVSTGNEQGLLGLAFSPDYQNDGTFYAYYTRPDRDGRLVRYTVSASDPDVANPTGTVILAINQPHSNHNGGWLAFGPDGYLYLSLGDGGSSGDPDDRAQDTTDILGKILRLDVTGQATYVPPPDNPYVGLAGLDEIWSLGLRNAWRCSFDRETGDLYIADVGQNAWEEINFSPVADGAGRDANFGWRCWEGNHSYNATTVTPCSTCTNTSCFVFPVHEYSHAGGCSVTGGYAYRGLAIPDLAGTYFFADYCSGEVFSFRMAGGAVTEFTDRTAELKPSDAPGLGNIASFGEDAFGELYICDIGGSVYKVVPASQTGVGPQPHSEPLLRLAGPSPFRDALRLALHLPEAGPVRVDVFDLAGRRVRALADRAYGAGEHSLSWDGATDGGRRVPAGLYFVRAATPFGTGTVKTVYLQ